MLGNVLVPRLCISALDDPICTREAIQWDECRRILFYDTEITSVLNYPLSPFQTANPNIVLATPQHGGHLAFFEGLAATSYWYFLPFW
ncbi:hypothetical protein NC653_041621 [Populus alba x Populus x berolinensis]|uniref:Uncharacterized protein n=1 Tax=Populus alba x Populus x berolinensis TaxID=444605 RepID=A0AAD6PPF6_9ROSI|nr:hypothetical protein NC653_041621 [Populus alba x Populus x berolinensis]